MVVEIMVAETIAAAAGTGAAMVKPMTDGGTVAVFLLMAAMAIAGAATAAPVMFMAGIHTETSSSSAWTTMTTTTTSMMNVIWYGNMIDTAMSIGWRFAPDLEPSFATLNQGHLSDAPDPVA